MSQVSINTHTKYKYLPIVHTYYSTNVLSINTYSSTNVLKYLYLPGRSSTHVLDHHHRTSQNLSNYTHGICFKICKYIDIQNKGGIQTNKQKINEYFYSFTSNPKSAILKE